MKWMNYGEKAKLLASMMASRLLNAYQNPLKIPFQHILFIRLDEIGDLCNTTHVFRMIRRQYPQAKTTLLCKSYGKELLASNLDIDVIITEWPSAKEKFDLIIDLRCNWKSILFSLKAWPRFRLDRGTVRILDSARGMYPHEVVTNYRVVESVINEANKTMEPNMAFSLEDQAVAENFIIQHQLGAFALLHISSRRELKKWPVENFCWLAAYLFKEKKLSIVFIGDSSESAEIEKAQQQLSFKTYNTSGKLTLTQLAALMTKATIYIGNDSGPLHMASILNTPCIGLYGPAPKDIFYPVGKKTAVIHHVLECNPCDQVHCVHPENPCINRITTNEVKIKLEELLS